jgi:predicted metal-dependent hydrolase
MSLCPMCYLEVMQIQIETIRTSRKKSVGFSVRWPDTMIVTAPRRLDKHTLTEMVEDRRTWAERRLSRINNEYVRLGLPKRYVGGESFPYLGGQYPLTVIASGSKARPKCVFANDRFTVEVQLADEGEQPALVKKALDKWYRQQAEAEISKATARWSPVVGKAPSSLRTRNQKARWGSCSRKGSINLNWRLVLLPPELLDYVVVHELCHLKQPDHSVRFWSLVGQIMPDFKQLRKRLRGYSPYLDLL